MLIGRNGQSTIGKNRPWKHTKNFRTTTREIKIFESCGSHRLDEICAVGSKRELRFVFQRQYLEFLSATRRNSPQRTLIRFQIVNVRSISRFSLIAAAI